MTKKPSAASRNQFLARAREHLRDTKTRLNHQATSELRAKRESDRGDGLDSSDLASEECDRDISSMLLERERLKISQIDGALQRIAEMKYGVCANCGFEITQERLKVMPFTRLCRDCQQEQEHAAKTRPTLRNDHGEVQEFDSNYAPEGNGSGPIRKPWNESEI
ncbi:MAG TPA: TraR/DksA C4-type zinc finger protein [Candidatus Binataceae bacterium]|jgi:RNA polymerase-binding protein DksA|nr:TraR/DksA C4-type zinc finger protein [Candidatus Binataceae bacterium]